ncbi:MAG: DUF2225 domain-containing protein [Lachnospiraceae bacterium]|nr:DUF2225 domain-containing protein [Lachnospiraceae bacterium]
MGLFSGLEEIGMSGLSNVKVFEDEKAKLEAAEKKRKEPAELKEVDFIFDKTYTCPICDREFKARTVRTGKVKLVGSDSDLRPRYQFDTLKYDAVTCPNCGYSVLTRYFPVNPTSGQIKLLRDNVCRAFKGIKEPGEIMTYDDALTRHKLALFCSIVKRGKASEKAYTCLKMAWLLRGKSETLPKDTPNIEAVRKDLLAQEMEAITNAYEGFTEAFSKENFPMCGMDETTVTYLTAELARKVGKYDDALRLCARVITGKGVNDRIKEKARDMKERIYVETGRKDG